MAGGRRPAGHRIERTPGSETDFLAERCAVRADVDDEYGADCIGRAARELHPSGGRGGDAYRRLERAQPAVKNELLDIALTREDLDAAPVEQASGKGAEFRAAGLRLERDRLEERIGKLVDARDRAPAEEAWRDRLGPRKPVRERALRETDARVTVRGRSE